MATHDPGVVEVESQVDPTGGTIEELTGGANPQAELDRAMLTQANVSFPSGTAVPKAPRQKPQPLAGGPGGGTLDEQRAAAAAG